MIVKAICDKCGLEYPAMAARMVSNQRCEDCSALGKDYLHAIVWAVVGASVLFLLIRAFMS